MNILLWVLQILAALLYASSGVMKVFLFDKVSKDVPSFGALPRPVWTALGLLELLGTIALILPGFLHSHTSLTIAAGIVLCVESLLFIWVHMKYTEKTPIMSAVLGIMMVFIAYGRFALGARFTAPSGDRTGSENHSLLISRTITPHKSAGRQ